MFVIWIGLFNTVAGCASARNEGSIRHCLEIEVDKSIGRAKNIRYTYGREFANEVKPSAIAIGPFMSFTSYMTVPDFFEIQWELADGTKRESKVPVRSRLPGSIKNKAIVFVIMADHIEAYVGISTPVGEKRERFY